MSEAVMFTSMGFIVKLAVLLFAAASFFAGIKLIKRQPSDDRESHLEMGFAGLNLKLTTAQIGLMVVTLAMGLAALALNQTLHVSRKSYRSSLSHGVCGSVESSESQISFFTGKASPEADEILRTLSKLGAANDGTSAAEYGEMGHALAILLKKRPDIEEALHAVAAEAAIPAANLRLWCEVNAGIRDKASLERRDRLMFDRVDAELGGKR